MPKRANNSAGQTPSFPQLFSTPLLTVTTMQNYPQVGCPIVRMDSYFYYLFCSDSNLHNFVERLILDEKNAYTVFRILQFFSNFQTFIMSRYSFIPESFEITF